MRQIEPSGPLPSDDELHQIYAYPADGTWLRANMISSVDGAAWQDHRTRGLGGQADQAIFGLLRGMADVVIAGAETVRVEGYGPIRPRPQWAELRADRPPAPPLAIVSRTLDLDLDSPLFTKARPDARPIILTCTDAAVGRRTIAAERADVVVAGDDGLDFRQAVDELISQGHRRLLCEGGPQVLAQIAAAGLLDELCLTISPKLEAGGASRVLNGPALPAAQNLRLAHAFGADGFLFLRYVRA